MSPKETPKQQEVACMLCDLPQEIEAAHERVWQRVLDDTGTIKNPHSLETTEEKYARVVKRRKEFLEILQVVNDRLDDKAAILISKVALKDIVKIAFEICSPENSSKKLDEKLMSELKSHFEELALIIETEITKARGQALTTLKTAPAVSYLPSTPY